MGILANFCGRVNKLLEVGVFISPNFNHQTWVPEFSTDFPGLPEHLVLWETSSYKSKTENVSALIHPMKEPMYYMYILPQKLMEEAKPVET